MVAFEISESVTCSVVKGIGSRVSRVCQGYRRRVRCGVGWHIGSRGVGII